MGNKYTFLFGAGAEGDGQLNMPSGAAFKRDIILVENVSDFANSFLGNEKDISKEKKYVLDNRKLLSSNSTSILYQTLKENENCEDIINLLFPENKLIDGNKDSREKIEKYLKYKNDELKPNEIERKSISDDFRKVYYERFYQPIVKNMQIEKDTPADFFLKNIGIYSYYDSLFNYLRKPELYKTEVCKVMKMYYAAFLSIYRNIYKVANKEQNEAFNTHIKKIRSDRLAVYRELKDLQKQVAEDNLGKEDLYYIAVKTFIKKYTDTMIVTTNYTSFAEDITRIGEDNIFYLHGKLDWFENLETKEIKSLCKFDATEFIFPYLLVQSGIKPIINHKQIKTIYKGSEALNNAETLIILGYGLNSDDEHIINMLRERVQNNGRIVCFIYAENDDDFENKKFRALKLLCAKEDSNISFEKSSNFNNYINDLAKSK